MNRSGIPAEALSARRERIERAWGLTDEAVLIPSGLPIPVDGTDATHAFHPHAEHVWLAGLFTPGQVLVFEPKDGWTLFARVATDEERIWEGDTEDFDSLRERTGLSNVRDLADLDAWLRIRENLSLAILGNEDIISNPRGYGGNGESLNRIEIDLPLGMRLQKEVTRARRTKDEWEIALMRRAAEATAAGHIAAMRTALSGMTERRLSNRITAEFLEAGADGLAYDSIVASRHRAAILHGLPTDRVMNDGELVLVDAGARVNGYNADITRTFPVGATFTPDQRKLYEIVLSAQVAACGKVVSGKEYREIHLETSVDLARGLVDFGVLRGDPEDLVAKDIHALFFPHGVGHMIGLGTHDVGGYAEGRERSERFGLMYLRADLPLEVGHVVTIEPGIYFIEALLANADRRKALESVVNWTRVDELMPLGGVRIEDDVLVTPDGPEILTAGTPKTVAEIEALRAEAMK
jgi:Xaa-Pro aminopeptidase